MLFLKIFIKFLIQGQRELPGDDFLAPNSVPMMGRKRGGRIFEDGFLAPRKRGRMFGLQSFGSPIMRLKKEERESPFVYRTPWHIGKRKVDDLEKRSAALSDIYTAAWIGSLFKPSSESKLKSRKMRLPTDRADKGIRGKFELN